MKVRGGKIVPLLLLMLVLCMAFSGCLLITEPESAAPSRPRGYFIDEDPIRQSTARDPLTVLTRSMTVGGCSVNYPFVASDSMDLLNLSIKTAFSDFAADCGVSDGTVSYNVEFNRSGLLSFTVQLTGQGGIVLFSDTASFNCDTGRRVYLDDCFGASYTDYPSRLSGLVTRFVEERGLTVVGSIPRIKDSTPFVFTNDGLALVFREYELCTHDGGAPRVPVPLSAVQDLVEADGLLNRIKE